jgi:hypothetical protein
VLILSFSTMVGELSSNNTSNNVLISIYIESDNTSNNVFISSYTEFHRLDNGSCDEMMTMITIDPKEFVVGAFLYEF